MKYYCIDAQSHEALRDNQGQWVCGETKRFPHLPGSATQEEFPDTIPANAVINAPIDPLKNNQAIIAEKLEMNDNGYLTAIWQRVADHRGEVWFDAEGQAVLISKLGDPSHLGLFTSKPKTEKLDRALPLSVPKRRRTSQLTKIRAWWQRLLSRGDRKAS